MAPALAFTNRADLLVAPHPILGELKDIGLQRDPLFLVPHMEARIIATVFMAKPVW